jgi:hypothetical protein
VSLSVQLGAREVGIETTRPQGTGDFQSIIENRRIPIIFKQLYFRHLRSHVGFCWLLLGYFWFWQLHFSYSNLFGFLCALPTTVWLYVVIRADDYELK